MPSSSTSGAGGETGFSSVEDPSEEFAVTEMASAKTLESAGTLNDTFIEPSASKVTSGVTPAAGDQSCTASKSASAIIKDLLIVAYPSFV